MLRGHIPPRRPGRAHPAGSNSDVAERDDHRARGDRQRARGRPACAGAGEGARARQGRHAPPHPKRHGRLRQRASRPTARWTSWCRTGSSPGSAARRRTSRRRMRSSMPPASTCCPGLINAHMHLQDERGGVAQPFQYEANLLLACGVTTVRDVGSDIDKAKQWRADSAAHTTGGAPHPPLHAGLARPRRGPGDAGHRARGRALGEGRGRRRDQDFRDRSRSAGGGPR